MLPRLSEQLSDLPIESRVQAVADFCQQLAKNMDFALQNLDESNFSRSFASRFLKESAASAAEKGEKR